jgi:hypothetical protein
MDKRRIMTMTALMFLRPPTKNDAQSLEKISVHTPKSTAE